MDILEHPLDAAAFGLYSFPDASAATGAAAWTCLAAVLAAAAAAGLWRLRCGSSAPAAAAVLKPLELEPSKLKEVMTKGTARSSSSDSAASTTTAAAAASPKERYTAYYRDSGRVGCCGVDDDEEGDEEEADEEEAQEEDEADGGCGVYETPEPFGWEEVVRWLPLSPTTAEMGRYHRSPTALSGSVVRLWDEAVVDAGVTASPRRRGRVVVGTVSAF